VSTEEEADELRLRVRLLQDRGYRTRTIDEDELRRLEQGLAPGPFVAAAFNENDGHADPQKVVDSCLSQARRRGAAVHVKTPVTGFNTSPTVGAARRLESVSTADGEIVCDAVVLAAGVATTKLAGLAGVVLPQEESPGVVVRTDPRPSVLQTVATLHTPSIDEDRLELHLRQNSDGTLLIGESPEESLGRDDSQRHADDLLGRAVHYLPDLAGARAIPVPVGYRPMPVDGLPVLGFTEAVPNMYVAMMHSGITLAPLVGEMAASEIVDGARVGLLEPYRPERFA
jgi:glycine/D-amino acid oxidase-like deaminating enzyme